MSRDILFKAKRIDNGEWIEGYYAVIGERKVIIAHPEMFYTEDAKEFYGNEIKDVDPSTVCQHTGKGDKYATKIFENSIIKESSYGYIGVVKFGEYEKGYGYYIEWISENAQFYREDLSYWIKKVTLVVVGNIFDNPDLLEVEHD